MSGPEASSAELLPHARSLRADPFDDGRGDARLTQLLAEAEATARALSAMERELRGARAALDAAPVGVAVLDEAGRIVRWNPSAERLLGWPADDALGRTWEVCTGAPPTGIRQALDDDDDGPFPLRARTRDGETVELEARAARMADPDPGAVVVLAPAPVRPPAAEPAEARPWTPEEMRRALLEGDGDLVDRIRAGIAAGLFLGRLRPGDRLPSIRDLSRHGGADHRSVSSAYRRLGTEGVVEVRNRHGVLVAATGQAPPAPSAESAAWLAGVVAQAAELQVKVAHLPDLLRRWTGEAVVRCACVEATEDGRTALVHEMEGQWGFQTEPLDPGALRRDALAAAFRDADVAVTTPFHAPLVTPVAQAVGIPVVVMQARPELVRAAEERLREGELVVVVADLGYGERLRCLAGGERLRIVAADDAEALRALDPAEPVLMTRAAHRRVDRAPRLLHPLSPAFSPACAGELASVLVRRNLEVARRN